MAGHSKWANIKHRKAAQDAKKGKVFTRIIREITVAAKGGAVPEDNPRLRMAIDKALSVNMKKDTIEKAILRGAGNTDGDNFDELTYEGYGPNGVAILVEAITDNRNRTVAEVRHAFSKHGGNLGTDGSVAYLFSKTGVITFPEGSNEDTIIEVALEAGAEDVIRNDDGTVEVQTDSDNFSEIRDALSQAGLEPETSEVAMLPVTSVELDLSGAEKIVRIVDSLEDLDDVQNVYTNADFDDDVLDQLS
jgi:YebC/PmpR family DNA-binding regulatory protein